MNASALVRQARRRAGLSQRTLASKAGVPQSTIGRVEAGIVDPRASTLARIMDACGYVLEAEPRLGDGVDRSQVREFLALTPRQRIESTAAAAHNIGRLRKKAKRLR